MQVRRPLFVICITMICPLAVVPLAAHEFWIDLERGQVERGERVRGELRVGEMLDGRPYPYLPDRFRRFAVTRGDVAAEVAGIAGDYPALDLRARESGLHAVTLHSSDFELTFDEWDVFVGYLEEEGLARFAEEHLARGLPRTGFVERYTRCIKALVQVGPVTEKDADVRVGMPIELVALDNPYAPGLEAIDVRLTWQGGPLADWHVSVFRDGAGDEEATVRGAVRTGADGRARVTLAGDGDYLLSAVHLAPLEGEDDGAVWHSHWAALSFSLGRAP